MLVKNTNVHEKSTIQYTYLRYIQEAMNPKVRGRDQALGLGGKQWGNHE